MNELRVGSTLISPMPSVTFTAAVFPFSASMTGLCFDVPMPYFSVSDVKLDSSMATTFSMRSVRSASGRVMSRDSIWRS